MKKHFLLAAIAALSFISQAANAQFNYNFTVSNQAYQPLTGATTVNGTTAWHDQIYSVPLGFNFNIDGKVVNKFIFMSSLVATDTAGTLSGFFISGTDLIDRGVLTGASKSPIRYTVLGVTGSRIFKIEFFNAGFGDEYDIHHTATDSLNLQVWMYEGTNVLELHYGTSLITHYSDYFSPDPYIGFVRDVTFATGSFKAMYVLKGNPTAPTIDSLSRSHPSAGLASYPASGTVYKYTPKGNVGINNVNLPEYIKMYPTVCSSQLVIENGIDDTINSTIVSVDGKVMINKPLYGGKTIVDVSTLPPGMYMIRMEHKEGTSISKFVKM
jgi:hypothetical protein